MQKVLALSAQTERIILPPSSMTGASNSVVEFVTLSKTTRGFSGRGQAAHFSVLMDRLANPVNFWVGPDPLMEGINHDNFVKLVGGVFGDPV